MKNKKLKRQRFSLELFNEIWFMEPYPIKKELLDLQRKLKGSGRNYIAAQNGREAMIARVEEIQQKLLFKKELERRFRPRVFIVKNGEMKQMQCKKYAFGAVGLDEDGDVYNGKGGSGSPCGHEDGTWVVCATKTQIETATTVSDSGELFKLCAHCEKELPFSDFGLHRGAPSGRQSSCRPCQAAYMKARKLRLMEKV